MVINTIVMFSRIALKETALPLIIVKGRDLNIIGMFKVIEELVGSDIIEKIIRVFNEALEDEVYKVLNTDNQYKNSISFLKDFGLGWHYL